MGATIILTYLFGNILEFLMYPHKIYPGSSKNNILLNISIGTLD